MNTKEEVMAWAKGILAKGPTAPPHELLKVRADVDPTAASDAFMALARIAHPDLHRGDLTETEFDQLVLAYSRVAGAYQELRSPRRASSTATPPMGLARTPTTPPLNIARTGTSTMMPPPMPRADAPAAAAPGAPMNSKALVYFRKAELALNRGDLRGAILQLKMAIAADPQSPVLRTALGEVQGELEKSKP